MTTQEPGRLEVEVKKQQQKLKEAEGKRDKPGMVEALHELGILHLCCGKYTEAREAARRCLQLAGEIGDVKIQVASLHQLGNVHMMGRDFYTAMKLYEEGLQVNETLGNNSYKAAIIADMSSIHWIAGQCPEALRLCGESLKVSEEIGDKAGTLATLYKLSYMYHKLDNYQMMETLDERAKKLREELDSDRSG